MRSPEALKRTSEYCYALPKEVVLDVEVLRVRRGGRVSGKIDRAWYPP